MDAHLTGDPCKECQRKFDQGMKSNEAPNAGIHFFDGYGGVSATKGVNPSACFDGVSHDFSRLPDVVQLSFLDSRHYLTRIVEPLLSQHNLIRVVMIYVIRFDVV